MILVVNAGSSSLKMLWMENNEKVLSVKWEKNTHRVYFKGIVEKMILLAQTETEDVFEFLIDYSRFLIGVDYRKPDKVGYRVVQGGEIFNTTTEVDENVLEKLASLDSLAPNHNPVVRAVVKRGIKAIPEARHFLCFDTMFHQTMPMVAKMYGINLKYYQRGIRKFGFHGLSHEYVTGKAALLLGKSTDSFSGIICHLGNGSSITAIENGKSIDTTMGLTPIDGLVMGERSGSIDPTVVKCISEIEGVGLEETIDILSKHSGFKAISGLTSDYRELKKAMSFCTGAEIAIKLFEYQITKYIGSFMAVLSHVDMIVFTGGIGENDRELVEHIVESPGLKKMGLSLGLNEEGKIPVVQIATDEEMAIAALIEKK